MFLQNYITLFAAIVDIQFMVLLNITKHIVIDYFMRDRIAFLHRFWLTLLLWMKDELMKVGEEDSVIIKMGSNYIRELGVNWEDVLRNCFKIDLF